MDVIILKLKFIFEVIYNVWYLDIVFDFVLNIVYLEKNIQSKVLQSI